MDEVVERGPQSHIGEITEHEHIAPQLHPQETSPARADVAVKIQSDRESRRPLNTQYNPRFSEHYRLLLNLSLQPLRFPIPVRGNLVPCRWDSGQSPELQIAPLVRAQ